MIRRAADAAETAAANRSWWDGNAEDYYAEHGDFLGDDNLVWGPEGWTDADLGILGDVRDSTVLEIGAGAAQGSRWVRSQGGRVVATDLSAGMLTQAATINQRSSHPVPLLQADATALPFAPAVFDLVFTAYGAVPFVADPGSLMTEAARVLRPGGRFVFSTSHPIRWAFPDDPGPGGLTATMSYWDTDAYVETDEAGGATYAEHHRTLGERIRDLTAAGLVLIDFIEPTWPAGNTTVWGGWSPLRGALLPGTAIFVAARA